MLYDVNFGLDVKVEILHNAEEQEKRVRVHCPLYKVREFDFGMSFSDTFTDYQILKDRDFITKMIQHFPNN
jgi:hypothetical protein